jgi:hypothetical protein
MGVGRKRFLSSLVLIAALLLPSVTLAQGTTASTGDWSGLKAVTSGRKLVIQLKNGKTVKGKLSSVSDTELSLSLDNKPVHLKPEDVLRVYQIVGKSAKKATLIGLGVGAAAGAVVGAAGGDDDGFFISRAQFAAGLSVLGAGVGAFAGFVMGKNGNKRMLIYEAKQP